MKREVLDASSASTTDDVPSARLPSIEELGQEWLPMETFNFKGESATFKEDALLSDGDSPPASASSSVNGSPASSCCSTDSPPSSNGSLDFGQWTTTEAMDYCLAAAAASYPPHAAGGVPITSPPLATTPTVAQPASTASVAFDASFHDAHGRSSGTNQLGRIYSPGLPLSMLERENIVRLYQNGWKICDISKRLCVTHSCVSKILNRFRQTGSVKPKDAKEGRVESPLVVAIRDYRYRLGMTRQSEIREQLIADGICTRETAPSRSSINHILRTKLDLKRKKKT